MIASPLLQLLYPHQERAVPDDELLRLLAAGTDLVVVGLSGTILAWKRLSLIR